ncbi:MAG: TAXI family TRAP transporter solute-binding subunit [Paracoccaceae bacterium]|nr:TAXI family TRAP transporter solute-binding subunit [Paracoccaceae bacterium]
MKHLSKAVLAASLAFVAPAAHAQAEEASYILATASTGGTYYPVGVALSTLVKVKLEPTQKIGMSAISSAGSNAALLGGLGLDINTDFELVFGGYGPAAEALQNGQVKGLGAPAGVPTGAISQLMASAGDGVKMLDFTPEELAQADAGRNLWTPYLIPAGTYPGQTEDINTVAQPNFLATNADLPEENVYLITKAIFENLPFLQAIHPATKEMAIEKALDGLPLPLHPGALRYYQEIGIDVPARLIAN